MNKKDKWVCKNETEEHCKAEVERIDRSHFGLVVEKGQCFQLGYELLAEFELADVNEAITYSRVNHGKIRYCLIEGGNHYDR